MRKFPDVYLDASRKIVQSIKEIGTHHIDWQSYRYNISYQNEQFQISLYQRFPDSDKEHMDYIRSIHGEDFGVVFKDVNVDEEFITNLIIHVGEIPHIPPAEIYSLPYDLSDELAFSELGELEDIIPYQINSLLDDCDTPSGVSSRRHIMAYVPATDYFFSVYSYWLEEKPFAVSLCFNDEDDVYADKWVTDKEVLSVLWERVMEMVKQSTLDKIHFHNELVPLPKSVHGFSSFGMGYPHTSSLAKMIFDITLVETENAE